MSATKGPWNVDLATATTSGAHRSVTVTGPSGCFVIFLEQIEGNGCYESMDDNARMMAASRDLYAALELMADAWDMPDVTKSQRAQRGKAWRAMRSALAKADGKPEPTSIPTAAESRNA